MTDKLMGGVERVAGNKWGIEEVAKMGRTKLEEGSKRILQTIIDRVYEINM